MGNLWAFYEQFLIKIGFLDPKSTKLTVIIEKPILLIKSSENCTKIAQKSPKSPKVISLVSVTIVDTKKVHLCNRIPRNELLTPTTTMHDSCALGIYAHQCNQDV